MRLGGGSLLNPASGILCPIPNHKGQFVGFQLRLDNPKDGCRYLWAAGEKTRDNRPTSHLRNGELPLSIDFPTSTKNNDTVGLAESVAFKPHIASIRLNIPFIGASGGHFASSPQTLKTYLEHLGRNRVILYPDAGAILNDSVLPAYYRTIALVESWGYEVKVAWWGQVEKAEGRRQKAEGEQSSNLTASSQTENITSAFCPLPSAFGDIDEIPQNHLEDIKYLTPKEFKELGEKLQFKQQCRDNWKKLKKFTSDIKINKRYFKLPNITENLILFISAGCAIRS